MDRTLNCLTTLIILNSTQGDYVSTDDLAEMLECNKRNIREYVSVLKDAGYDIISKQGKYGGYRLNYNTNLKSIGRDLTKEEFVALHNASIYLNSANTSFTSIKDFDTAVGKILAISRHRFDEIKYPLKALERFPSSSNKSLMLKFYKDLDGAITSKKRALITYKDSKGLDAMHKVDPYYVYAYHNDYYLIAWDLGNDSSINSGFKHFKLTRMKDLRILNEHYNPDIYFDYHDYVDDYGIKSESEGFEEYDVLIKFTGVLQDIIKEHIYGKNQKIIENEDGTFNLSCRMRNKMIIISFVLSYNSACELLEPKELRDEIKSKVALMNNIYNGESK